MNNRSPAVAAAIDQLKPCPFCGGKDLTYHEDTSEDEPTMKYAWHVFCRDCHCHGRNNFPIGWCESKEAAAEAWNLRGHLRHRIDDIEAQPSPEAEKVMEEIYWANTIEDPTLDQFRPAILPILTRYAAAVRAQNWQTMDTAPKDGTVINAVARYPDATSGFPTYISFMDGKWVASSRTPLHKVIPWAWRPRDEWPVEPPTQGGE